MTGQGIGKKSGIANVFQQPIVVRALILEFERADRVRNLLQCVFEWMGVAIKRVNAPLVTGAMVMSAFDAINRWIAQIDIGGTHIDPGAQNVGTICVLSIAHFTKQAEIFRDTTRAKRRIFTLFSERAPVGAHVVGVQAVDIGMTLLDQAFGEHKHPLKIIRGKIQIALAVSFVIKPQPVHALQDGIDEFLFFPGRVGIVKAQVASASVITGEAKIEADRFRMSDVQIAVRLRWKAGADFCLIRTAAHVIASHPWFTCPMTQGEFVRGQVRFDDVADEIGWRGRNSLTCAFACLVAVWHGSFGNIRE